MLEDVTLAPVLQLMPELMKHLQMISSTLHCTR